MSKTLIITDRIKLWDKNYYDIFTLLDLVTKPPSIKYDMVIIDNTIAQKDVTSFESDFDYLLFNNISKYMKAYSILIHPSFLHHNKGQEWYLIGSFRFKSNKVFHIFSTNKFVDLTIFFKNKENIIETTKEKNIPELMPDENQKKLALAKEQAYKTKNQKRSEIILESIHSFEEYVDFIRNRDVLTRFINGKISNLTGLNQAIRESDASEYCKTLFTNILKKYEGVTFPYNDGKPLSIYYVIILHNRLLKDKLFDRNQKKIAKTIGVFSGNLVKGIIIESVMFTSIPDYDSVQLLKINNGDNYHIWMKAELDLVDGKKVYESRLKNYNYIQNAIKKYKPIRGGTKKHRPLLSNNKTISAHKK